MKDLKIYCHSVSQFFSQSNPKEKRYTELNLVSLNIKLITSNVGIENILKSSHQLVYQALINKIFINQMNLVIPWSHGKRYRQVRGATGQQGARESEISEIPTNGKVFMGLQKGALNKSERLSMQLSHHWKS